MSVSKKTASLRGPQLALCPGCCVRHAYTVMMMIIIIIMQFLTKYIRCVLRLTDKYSRGVLSSFAAHHANTTEIGIFTLQRLRAAVARTFSISSAFLFFSWAPYSVKTPLLAHTTNNLFDHIWRKGMPFGTLVQKFSTSTPCLPKF